MTRDALRIRQALADRGYVVAEDYTRRQMRPPAVWCYDDDVEECGIRPVLWAWTVPYYPAGKPDHECTLHAPNVWDALDQIERLPMPEVHP